MERIPEHRKPNPAIKKKVARARQKAKGTGRAQVFVIAASLTATLTGWALFTNQDAELAATEQLAADNSPIVSTQQTASSSPTPLVTALETSSTNGPPTTIEATRTTTSTSSSSGTVIQNTAALQKDGSEEGDD